MFDQFINSASITTTRRWRYFIATALIWIGMVSGLLFGSIWAYDAHLTDCDSNVIYSILPPLPVSPPPKGAGTVRDTNARDFTRARLEPVQIVPKEITTLPKKEDLPYINYDFSKETDTNLGGGGVIGGVPGGVKGVVSGGSSRATKEIPPPSVEKPAKEVTQFNKPIRIPNCFPRSAIRRVEPAYPELAKRAGIAGSVLVEIEIDESGNVVSAKALSGHIPLKDAAVQSALLWKWKPSMLNGSPVRVVGTITFIFKLV